jgi:hypothetical protein
VTRLAALAASLLAVACGVRAPPRPPVPERDEASRSATEPQGAVHPERSDAASAAERSRGTDGAQPTP